MLAQSIWDWSLPSIEIPIDPDLPNPSHFRPIIPIIHPLNRPLMREDKYYGTSFLSGKSLPRKLRSLKSSFLPTNSSILHYYRTHWQFFVFVNSVFISPPLWVASGRRRSLWMPISGLLILHPRTLVIIIILLAYFLSFFRLTNEAIKTDVSSITAYRILRCPLANVYVLRAKQPPCSNKNNFWEITFTWFVVQK